MNEWKRKWKKRINHVMRTGHGNETRRGALKKLGSAVLLGAAPVATGLAQLPRTEATPDFRIRNGRIRQSVMGWCFNPMPVMDLARACREIGLAAMEGISEDHYQGIRDLGLEIALVGSHGFSRGPVSRDNIQYCVDILKRKIDVAKAVGSSRVITFTGMVEKGTSPEKSASNCVECWKAVMSHAEKQGISLCLEHLNSRDDSHPMKGHPGYFGDDIELCIDMIKRVDSPNMKLLFDIYHVQIMHGDVIRRIRSYHPWIGHYHTAGNPGRSELDDTQEINYPAILHEILKTGYEGFVAQEFIPTWDDSIAALRHAAQVCDI